MLAVAVVSVGITKHPLEGNDGEANRSADGGGGGGGGVALAHGSILQHSSTLSSRVLLNSESV